MADFDAALAPGAPRVDDSLPYNLVSHQSFTAGDPARHFADAEYVVEAQFRQSRQTHAPIETRGCCAIWDGGRRHLTMHIGNQVPHPLRTQLARRLRLSESQVTVICPDIGGGFGQKIALYREELTIAALARQLRRPVRWREDRGENLMAASHAREQTWRVARRGRPRAAAFWRWSSDRRRFRRLLLLSGELSRSRGGDDPDRPVPRSRTMPSTSSRAHQQMRRGPMRAPMAITSWVMEGTIEAIARRLGRDPIDVRRLNMLPRPRLPYAMPTGPVLEDVTPRETLEAALRGDRRCGLPRAPGGGPGARRLSRHGAVLRRRIHHLRLGILQGRRHSRLGPRGRLGQGRALGRGQRLGRTDGLRPGL